MRRFQIVAFVSLGISILLFFPASRIDCLAAPLPKGLPPWFKELDKDGDGQVSLYEWRQGGRKLADFRKYDLNGDGFITPDEVLRVLKKGDFLEPDKGPVNSRGAIEEAVKERYRGKKSFKIFTVKFERGTTYQIDHVSQVFYAYLYLEGPRGELLAEHNSRGMGRTSRIVHRAATTGTYRIIATSQDGWRTGPFSMSVRVLYSPGGASPKGLPPWFKELDTDRDGQVSLSEWRRGGKGLAEFRKYDLNDDGFITPEEVLRALRIR
jgi:Ca2+-binding EF-hand superfamily protein